MLSATGWFIIIDEVNLKQIQAAKIKKWKGLCAVKKVILNPKTYGRVILAKFLSNRNIANIQLYFRAVRILACYVHKKLESSFLLYQALD